MKQIKFRAWHKPTGKIYPVKRMIFGLSNHVLVELLDYDYGENDRLSIIKFDHIMQFTGLRDKNGKEIYEGDIVKNGLGGILIIESCPGGFQCRDVTNGLLQIAVLNNEAQVVDNIYEELMTKNDEKPSDSLKVFQCPDCGMVSHNPHDLENLYCGFCYEFKGKSTP